jgi:hypothetical protein
MSRSNGRTAAGDASFVPGSGGSDSETSSDEEEANGAAATSLRAQDVTSLTGVVTVCEQTCCVDLGSSQVSHVQTLIITS